MKSLSCHLLLRIFVNFWTTLSLQYNNEECIALVEKIIRRHNLSAGMTEHGKLFTVDDNYIEERVKQLFAADGEIGTIVKFGMFSG